MSFTWRVNAIIPAGGTSSRFGNKNKLLEKINDKEVIKYTVEAFENSNVDEIIICANISIIEELENIFKDFKKVKIIQGGETRQASVYNALKACDEPDIVAIHDAARPLIKKEDIEKCLNKAIETKAAIVGVKAVDTIKQTDNNNKITSTPDRNHLWYVQTPQIFDYKIVMQAHKKFEGQGFSDDAGLVEANGKDVYITEGSYSNIKITTKKDILLAQMLYKN